MSDDLVKRPLDEVFDTQREVERNPCGAWQAIQSQANRIEELERGFWNLHREYDKRGDRIEELEAKLAIAMEGLRQSEGEIDNYIRWEYPSDHPVHEQYRKRDFAANPARITLAELKRGIGDE
jgi:predicted RNase H-like nuclease (RuvC/YqgF family)